MSEPHTDESSRSDLELGPDEQFLFGEPDPVELHLPEKLHIGESDTDEAITEKLRRQGVNLGKGLIAPRVFWPALIVIVGIVVLSVAIPEGTGNVILNIQNWIVDNLGWYYMLVVGLFVAFAIVVGFSKFGKIRLGKDDDKPEFGVLSWFAMLFAAGMGIGLVFYGVAEPLTYATTGPKPGWAGGEVENAQMGMAQTFVHWGLHPWALYAVLGMALAYAIHRRGRPLSIRWALEPLLGNRVKGWAGDLIDVIAIFGTVFGIATSLGLGVQQISAGLKHIGVVGDYDNTFLIILIVIITFLATASVVSGVGAGIKWLSNINLTMAGVLLVTVLVLGPTLFLFQNFVESLGVWLANVLDMTFDIGAYTGDEGNEWNSTWTLFYWGWWISWAPFVGVFIARISRGRTVREFIAGVLLVPSIVGFFWFSVLGGTGIHTQLFGSGDLVDPDEGVVAERVLFDVLGALPLGSILSVFAIILVAIFFITSSDSGSLVVDMLASGGHPNPPMWSRVLWALLEGAIAIALLVAGGLDALQAGSLMTALPFSVVLILICVSTLKAFGKEAKRTAAIDRAARFRQVGEHLADDFDEYLGEKVDERIDYRLTASQGILGKQRAKAARRKGSAAQTQSTTEGSSRPDGPTDTDD
ncbi:BCCT family transporter [Brevibacterium sp. SMBL_HHYL_HB1]|jgi:choline/glycine/proline betaine transport protein|uniref:BCCT family transporter n=1 Tax=Brevibacterium sp. SMBL_HHYL_HB1 TaxID=2777556 RepID=UPI001BA76D94|nr:BCCT family transporter [Brevibacterium sp. SMBL_HHYL_HB1]QUL79200.1 BCCT family transporter [Brevibacterium sp. SMBL_HHYL_HB1]